MKSLYLSILIALFNLFSNAQAATIAEVQMGITAYAGSAINSSGDFYDQDFISFAASPPTASLAASVTGSDLTSYAWTPNAHMPSDPAVDRAYIDLSFDNKVYNGEGADLVLFFAGNGTKLSTGIERYLFSIDIGADGTTEGNLLGVTTDTTSTIYGTDFFASYALIDLDDLGFGKNARLSDVRIYLDDTSMPALAALGAYHDSPVVVPLPLSSVLFGSGLALLSLFRRKSHA